MGMKLFDDDKTENDDFSEIVIDKEFARRYEHNKDREYLQRYEREIMSGQNNESESQSDSESSDEEDDTELKKLSKKENIKKLFENLNKVKNHHPSVYQPVDLFESESDSDHEIKDENENRKEKPKYLKDVVAQHLIEEGPEFQDVESNKMKKTYNEEQDELKKAFLDEVKNFEEDGDGDGLLKEKDNKDDNDGGDDDEGLRKNLDQYFGPDDVLDENSKFLKDFFEKRMWIDRENKTFIDDTEIDVSEDDEEVYRQEDYEASYNFRHEENAGDRVMGHSRIVDGSVRKEKNSRKKQRESKMERMKIDEMERKEKLKHLKNLKKKEMKEKLMKVMEVAGVTNENDFELDLEDLDEDFDPAEYDKKMNKAFGNEYYNANDKDPEFGSDEDGDIEKPDFGKEDELLGLPKGWDVVNNDVGFLAARKKALEKIAEDEKNGKTDEEEEDDDNGEREAESDSSDTADSNDEEESDSTDTEDSNGDEDNKEEESGTKEEEITKKRKRKEKMSLVQKAKEAMLEEYYKLDYEDAIGDLKTRFKYAKVQPNRFGLKTEEVLMLDDKDLNQYVSVKKIAPYRESEWKVPDNKRREYKEKARELRRGKWNHGTISKKKSSRNKDEKTKSVSDQERKPESEESNMEVAKLSKNQKRKLRERERKLSESRRRAYQGVQQKANGKRKR